MATLVDRNSEQGIFRVTWRPQGLASGVYLCILKAGQVVQVEKLTLLK